MSEDRAARIAELTQQERELVFDAFSHRDAWTLGTLIAERAAAGGSPVAIDIRRPGLVLFRVALDGSTPDQESWIAGKSAVVLRMESSTALLEQRLAQHGIDATNGWLPRPEYAVSGGSFPIRVRGVGVVAAATVSGLASDEDHELIVSGIREFLGQASDATSPEQSL